MDLRLFIFICGAVAAFFMLFSLGANDVANSIGVAIGSNALTPTNAIIIAALCNLFGATLGGEHVSKTLSDSVSPALAASFERADLAWAFVVSLLSSSATIFLGTLLSLPLSSTHAVVGSVAGAGLVIARSAHGINWSKAGGILTAWVMSPLLGGLLGGLLRWGVWRSGQRGLAGRTVRAGLTGGSVGIVSAVLVGGVVDAMGGYGKALGVVAFVIGAVVGAREGWSFGKDFDERIVELEEGKEGGEYWKRVLLMAVCSVAFAHGSNDVANGVGPFLAVLRYYLDGELTKSEVVGVLGLGGVGIALGLSLMGYRVVRTIGGNGEGALSTTKWTYGRAFATQFAGAVCVLGASWGGWPVSTSHVVVGAVVGVGVWEGWSGVEKDGGVRWQVLLKVLIGGLLTPLISGTVCALFLMATVKCMHLAT